MTTDSKPRDTRFKPGKSGNPAGRPLGARAKALATLDALAEGEVTDIAKAMIEKAKEGDTTAGRLILDRAWPMRKGRGITFELPHVSKVDDLPEAISAVTRQVADGEISPEEGATVVSLLEAHRKAIETNEFSVRLAALEERMGKP
jgi:hypothetical protein